VGAQLEKVMANPDPFKELEEFLIHMARMIVDMPEEVVVNPAKGRGFIAFEVICDDTDTGTLIGRRGKHADALRTMMMAAGAVRDIRVTVQIVSRDQDELPAR
jgi:predicted RNA-binding protein YlqC (UPF0109 family)